MTSQFTRSGYLPTFIMAKFVTFPLFFLGILACWYSVWEDIDTFLIFVVFFITSAFVWVPKFVLSPATVLMGYYGLWFVLSPIFGSGYTNEVLQSYPYKLSIALVASTYFICLVSISLGGWVATKVRVSESKVYFSKKNTICFVVLLYMFATIMVFLIVQNSGGISKWLDNAGDAFLNRSGTGVYVILSHFFSILLAFFSGYLAYEYKKTKVIFFFVLWLVITSPVHGSKFQISLLLIVSLLPWLKEVRVYSIKALIFAGSLIFIFIAGMAFRGLDYQNPERLLGVFNYFSTLHNLAISVRDFDPGSMSTFFYPFNKFLTPFGLTNQVEYFDMNHLLTDIYYPEAWEIRATEQWPVETDLYLNFYYFGGIPLIMFYMSFLGFIHYYAIRSFSLGGVLVSVLLTLFMISHLRGSLYNHTDFYMLPYFFILIFFLKKYRLS